MEKKEIPKQTNVEVFSYVAPNQRELHKMKETERDLINKMRKNLHRKIDTKLIGAKVGKEAGHIMRKF